MTPADDCLISLTPANGKPLGFVEATALEQVSTRVQQARIAQTPWAALGLEQRAATLQQAATALLANATGLAALLSEETGKPRQAAFHEVQQAAHKARSDLERMLPTLDPVLDSNGPTITYREPLGTCAILTPWESPIALSHGLMIPALLAGNTVVLKPSPETPLVSQQMVAIYQRFLPEDVLQIVHGKQRQGQALVASNVKMVAFCGSSKTAKHIMASAAFGLKRLVLATGSKNIAIVLADANLEAAAEYVAASSFGNRPRCTATERVFVDSRIAEEFEYRVAGLCQNYRIGTWDDPNTNIGPMISVGQRQHVLKLIGNAIDNGATTLSGGGHHPEFFVRPTILGQINSDMNIAHREINAPVLCISRFTYPREAIALANYCALTQGAMIFGNEKQASSISRHLDAAAVAINTELPRGPLPWLGASPSVFDAGDLNQQLFVRCRSVYR